MKRDLNKFCGKEFDVLIIGGGIYGVAAAWDAALRGLDVALVEKNDFGGATSSNSLKIIHGGLRYLQHADFKRMRESIQERKILMRIAPHLVHPLACVMPTFGHALKGKEVMAIALFLNDLVGFDRNGLSDSGKFMPRGRVISKAEIGKIIPGLDQNGLTGGAIWYDCQVHNSERLLLAFLNAAVNAGATAANYLQMTDFRVEANRISGIVARDLLTGSEFEVSAKLVINNTGPWFSDILNRLNGHAPKREIKQSAAMNLVVRKKLFAEYAVGLFAKQEFKDEDAIINKGARLFFVTPWKEYSLIGTTHVPYEGDPENFKITEKDIQNFLNDVNKAYPAAALKREDVVYQYGGLLPVDDTVAETSDVKLLKNYQIIDHAEENGLEGLLSVISVKFTTARDVAEKTIDGACKKLNYKMDSRTSTTPLFGGEFDDLQNYIEREKARGLSGFCEADIEYLIRNYGSEYPRIVNYARENNEWRQRVAPEHPVLKAEVVHAVRDEMALRLTDVVRRRTELGSACYPGDEAVQTCARLMQAELGWSPEQSNREISEAKALYQVENA